MRGIRIQPEIFSLHSGAFAEFFAPILSQLVDIHWLYHAWPFERGDVDFSQAVAKLPPDYETCNPGFGYIPPGLLLPRFARFVTSDWASFYGFHQKPNAKAFFDAMPGTFDYAFLSRTVDLCFFNVDAVFWEFYSRDESLLNLVRTHAATLQNVFFEDRDLLKADW